MNPNQRFNDPFEDPSAGIVPPASHSTQAPGVSSVGGLQPSYPSAVPYSGYNRYGASPYPTSYSNFGTGMYGGGAYTPYNTGYGGGYGVPTARAGTFAGGAERVQTGSAAVLSGMQEAMQRFARVSGLMEEVLRNLHLLFDGVFGLGYSVGAFYDEARLWLAVKTGPAAFLMRVLRKLAKLWRLITIFLCSPLAGEFSPVSLVLRMLDVAPLEESTVSDEFRFDGALESEITSHPAGSPLSRTDSNL